MLVLIFLNGNVSVASSLKDKSKSNTAIGIKNTSNVITDTGKNVDNLKKIESSSIVLEKIEEELNNMKPYFNKVDKADLEKSLKELDCIKEDLSNSKIKEEEALKRLENVVKTFENMKEIVKTNESIPYIQGYPNKTFRGQNKVSREEAATFLSNILGDIKYDNYAQLHDIYDRWSTQNILKVYNNGIIKGYPGDTFKPKSNMTRAEALAILLRYENIDIEKEIINKESKKEHWAQGYIDYGLKENIVIGYPNGDFNPNKEITRAEFITMINRLLKRNKVKDISLELIDIKDEWYEEEVLKGLSKY